jgi:hypothetical protein
MSDEWKPITIIEDAGEPPDETDDALDPFGRTKARLGIAPETTVRRFVIPAKAGDAWAFGIAIPSPGDWARGAKVLPPAGVIFYDLLLPDGSVMDAWCALLRLRIKGNPIAVERHFHPSPNAGEELWRGVSQASPVQVKQARRYIDLLNFAQKVGAARGRKRLEDSATSPWRAVAEQAREMMRTEPTLKVPDVAARLLINYDDLGYDSVAEAKAEARATRNLYRYLKLLDEVEKQERSARSARPS